MKSLRTLALSLLAVPGLTSPGAAQGQTDQSPEFIQVITTTAKSGAVSDYEDFVRKIVAGANKIGASQRWTTSQVILGGPGLTYTVVLPFAKWADVDDWTQVRDVLLKAFGQAEGTRILKSGRAAIDHTEATVYRLLPDLSTRPKAFIPPPAFVHLFMTEVEPPMVAGWRDYLAKLKVAQEKSPKAPTAIRRTAVLGSANTFLTAVPFNKFAERDDWPSNMDVMREAYGESEAQKLDEIRLKSMRSGRQLVLAYRPDLSRPPATSQAAGR
jgi:hypothetical protein